MSEQATLTGLEPGGVELSDDGVYRYRLWRNLTPDATGPDPRVVTFVMLNPSVADAKQNDPTLRRCMGYAQDWGFDRLDLVNLYAYRTPLPDDLLAADDPVGPLNDEALTFALSQPRGLVVCGWGANVDRMVRARPEIPDPRARLTEIAASYDTGLTALRVTKAGDPWHPLYLKADLRPRPWP